MSFFIFCVDGSYRITDDEGPKPSPYPHCWGRPTGRILGETVLSMSDLFLTRNDSQ